MRTPIRFACISIIGLTLLLSACDECRTHSDCDTGYRCQNGSCVMSDEFVPSTGTPGSGGGSGGTVAPVDTAPSSGDTDVTDTESNEDIAIPPHDTSQYANCYEGSAAVLNILDVEDLVIYDCILGDLYIVTQTMVTMAFPNLRYVGGDLILQNNQALLTTDGLDLLQRIDGSVTVHNNSLMEDLSGFQNIEFIGGGLTITFNEVLYSLAEMRALRTIQGELTVRNNLSLPSCHICDLLLQLEEGPSSRNLGDNRVDGCSANLEQCGPQN